MAGRPTKYTPEVVQRLITAIKLGAPYDLACHYAGISDETFARWRRLHVDFMDAIKAAEGSAVVQWLAKIEQAASDGNWQAAAWKLERRYPESFGRVDRLDVTFRKQAEAVAAELGVPVEDVIREAERIANAR